MGFVLCQFRDRKGFTSTRVMEEPLPHVYRISELPRISARLSTIPPDKVAETKISTFRLHSRSATKAKYEEV